MIQFSVSTQAGHHRSFPRHGLHRTAILALIAVAALLTQMMHASVVGAESTNRPNIVVILADDMGYGDLGCTGSRHLQTRHIDALARSGVLCTQAYVASAVCSPSRAGLLTGRDPRRFGYEGNLNASAANYATRPELLGLPPGEHTLGDHLRHAGYATALVGKWHLGMGEGFHPQQRGFDHFCGMLGGSHTYFPDPDRNQLERNGQPLREFSSPYLTDFFTDEALNWLREQSEQENEKPWFLFLSYNAPHGPLQATEEDLARFSHIIDSKRRTYAAMMYAMDRGIGRVMEFLDQTDQRDNTIVCFFSDNGGATNNGSWNGPLSGVKGCLKEGGIRIPMIWSWPDRLPDNTVHDGVVSSLDLLTTLLSAAQSEPLALTAPRSHEDPRNREKMAELYGDYDGRDLLPQLAGTADPIRRTLFWRLQGQTAILDGADKLITLSHRPPQLFQPGDDVAEEVDRFHTDRTRADELFRMLGQWQSSLPTVPLWDSSPYWIGQSANQYDGWQPRDEPK